MERERWREMEREREGGGPREGERKREKCTIYTIPLLFHNIGSTDTLRHHLDSSPISLYCI